MRGLKHKKDLLTYVGNRLDLARVLRKRDMQLNGNQWPVLWVWMLLLALGIPASPAISMPLVSDSASGLSTAHSGPTPEWHNRVAHLISHQLCNSSLFNGEECSSSVRNSAAGSASYPLHAFEEFGWSESLLPMRAAAVWGSSEFFSATQSRKGSIYNQSLSPVDADRLEFALHSLHDVPRLTAKQVVPGSLLVTILALIGIVAVARRDIAGNEHASATVAVKARPGVVSVTYLRRGAN